MTKRHEDCATRDNPYLDAFLSARSHWPAVAKGLFASEIPVPTRTKAFLRVAEIGAELSSKYAWAIPDERILHILANFCSPLVEIGAGEGYWSGLLRARGAKVAAFDIRAAGQREPSAQRQLTAAGRLAQDDPCWSGVSKGGPEVLEIVGSRPTLFLCYPDEFQTSAESLALQCLLRYQGEYVAHVGELIGDTLSMEHAPWGRTTGAAFQVELLKRFQCVAKIPLRYRWPHSRDYLTIFRRTTMAMLVLDDGRKSTSRSRKRRSGARGRGSLENDGDDEEDDDAGEAHIFGEYDSDDIGGQEFEEDLAFQDTGKSEDDSQVSMWKIVPQENELIGDDGMAAALLKSIVDEGTGLLLEDEEQRKAAAKSKTKKRKTGQKLEQTKVTRRGARKRDVGAPKPEASKKRRSRGRTTKKA